MKAKSSAAKKTPNLKIYSATADRWRDLETLFGPRGACAGCWCMFWRLRRSQFDKQKGIKNKRALKKLVESDATPGLLAYANGEPVGWCALAPREAYPVLERSRILARVDNQPVWSVVCFFVAKAYRRSGVTMLLLRAAVDYVAKRGAKILEGYPIAPKTHRMPDVFAWTGFENAFRKAGFKEVARRSATRPIMRRVLDHPLTKRLVPF